jgi:transposase-like protein
MPLACPICTNVIAFLVRSSVMPSGSITALASGHRDVEELLFEYGIIVSCEAIRKWCRKFGQDYANKLRRRRPHPGDKWHLDEVF